MYMHPGKRPARTGFTLIEILVVVAIIAILISLLMAAVFKSWSSGARVVCQTEIREMELAFSDAMKHFNNIDYLPGTLTLSESGNYPPQTAIVLQRMFGKNILGHPVDWNGNGTIDGGAVTLYGEELLVFYLGGIPSIPAGGTPTVTGFSSDPGNPGNSSKYWDQSTANQVWLKPRILPFYKNFNSSRLVPSPVAPGFLRYKDPFTPPGGNFYLYFSTQGGPNNYPGGQSAVPGAPQPYFQGSPGSPQFFNPNSFQILSAGMDGIFGPGGQYDGSQGYGLSGPGADDIANFSKSVLGGPVN